MELQFYGANCLRFTTKKAAIVVDDNLKDLGQKSATKDGDIALFTGVHAEPPGGIKMAIDQAGEYEVSDISIKGIAARGHMEEAGSRSATIFRFIAEDIRTVVVGHVYPELSDEQLEAIGTVDVMCIPVGGGGYTLDPIGALALIKKIEPKVIIPTHYADKTINYPVPQLSLEEAIKQLSMEPSETVPKIKFKHGEFGEAARLIVLERQ